MTEISIEPIKLEDIKDINEVVEEYTQYSILDYTTLIVELNETGIELDKDPTAAGLSTLNMKIAQIDAQKTRIATILSSAIVNENCLELMYKQLSNIYKREFDTRLIQEPARSLPNAASREAACNALLTNLKSFMTSVEGSHSQARTFTNVVRNELSKLDSTNKNVSRQITVIQQQIEIGEIMRQQGMNDAVNNMKTQNNNENKENKKDEFTF